MKDTLSHTYFSLNVFLFLNSCFFPLFHWETGLKSICCLLTSFFEEAVLNFSSTLHVAMQFGLLLHLF